MLWEGFCDWCGWDGGDGGDGRGGFPGTTGAGWVGLAGGVWGCVLLQEVGSVARLAEYAPGELYTHSTTQNTKGRGESESERGREGSRVRGETGGNAARGGIVLCRRAVTMIYR